MATDRYHRLLGWMKEYDITFTALGQQIGKDGTSARKAVFKDTVPSEIHSILLQLGFPAELLPTPVKGRKRSSTVGASERYYRLLDWMGEHKITFDDLGRQVGKGGGSARYALLNETVAPEIHEKLLRMDVPQELLPAPSSRRRGPAPKQPRFPGLMQA